MRKGFDGLAAQVQTVLKADPFSGHLFLFRGKRGDLLKALWWDGQGLVLLARRLENAMRWVEMLAAALFTFEMTGSGMAVAFVSAARSLPLLCLGAIVGVVCEAVNRKHILLGGMLLSCAAGLSICLLDLLGWARPWHIALAAFLSGSVWATEMATRRRMVGEAAGAGLVSQAVALDSLTNAFARMPASAPHGDCAAVLRPGAFPGPELRRAVLAERDRLDPRRRDPNRDKDVSCGVGTPLAEGQVVLPGASLIGMALDAQLHLSIAVHPLRLALQDR
jgi:hypothetical protein